MEHKTESFVFRVRHTIVKLLGSGPSDTIVRFIILITLTGGIVTQIRQSQINSCYTHYNEANAQVQMIRARITDEDRKIIDDLNQQLYDIIRSPGNPGNQAKLDQAFADYFRKRKENDERRKLNPAPELPSTFCN